MINNSNSQKLKSEEQRISIEHSILEHERYIHSVEIEKSDA